MGFNDQSYFGSCRHFLITSVRKSLLSQKIAGCKLPLFVDPSHRVYQGGKGSADRRTDRRTDGSTSGPFLVPFRSTGRTLGWSGGGLAHPHPQPSLAFQIEFADIRTDGHTYRKKNVTPKDPLRINARDLKNHQFNILFS